MSKGTIRKCITKVLAFILAFSMCAETSIVGYASNNKATDEGMEIIVDTESAEEETNTEETTTEETTTEETTTEETTTEEITTEESSKTWENAEEEGNVNTEATETTVEFVIEDGVLTAYNGTATDVVIPDEVTEIADRVFINKTFIRRVTLPLGLKKIGSFAFCGCTGLVDISLNEGLESIGDDAFYGVAFGGVDENNQTVYGTIIIPSTVTYIGYEAFCNCTYLEEVIFSNEGSAEIEFGKKDEKNSMFRACANLKEVTLPDRVVSVPSYAFQNCSSLETVVFGKNTETIENLAFNKCPSYKELICPNTLRSIENYAFSDCKLENIQLNEGLESIGEGAFYGVNLGEIIDNNQVIYGTLTIPSSVTYIGNVAFGSCAYLGEVVFSNEGTEPFEFGLKDGKNSMFMASPNLKKVTLPNRMTDIPGAAFQNCPLLEQVTLGNATKSIGTIAFNKCPSLKELVCPESLETIGDYAFANCEGLVTISLNEGLRTIGQGAFYNAGIIGVADNTRLTYSTLTIPGTVQEIGVHAFFNCKEYETFIFSNGTNDTLNFAGDQGDSYAFQNCLNLKTVYLPNRLRELKSLTFMKCPKLETLYIPETVETIADNFIEYCDLTKITIYGTTGSAAEKYATENGVTFIDESELGIYAKSIQLNYKNLSFSGPESFGKTVRLNATVLPGTAQNREVIYSSKDNSVATVDSSGVVTIVGYGETDIVVSSKENANVFETCHVDVLKKWSVDELKAVRQSIIDNNNLTIIVNGGTNLQEELVLQTGMDIMAQWKLPYEVETGTHVYAVRVSREGYETIYIEDIPVTGVEVTGISLDGSNNVQVNTETQICVEVLTEGGEISSQDCIVEWECANTNNVSIVSLEENPLAATVTGLQVNKGTNLTAKLYLKKAGNIISDSKEDLGKTWFEGKKKIVVTKDAVVDGIEVSITQNGKPVTLEALNTLVDLNGTSVYDLRATAYAGGKKQTQIPLVFKSSNSKVAKVVTDKTGKTTLSVLGKGTSVITVKAAKNGGYVTSFRVTVKDSMPRLAQKTVTMNRYLLDVHAYVTIMPSDGYILNEDSLSVVNAKDGSTSEFVISKVGNYEYKIATKSGSNIKKGNYAVKILAKTNANEKDSHELPLTIKVTEQKPKVTIKQTAITSYMKDSYGVIEVVTSDEISDMRYTSSAGMGKARLVQKEADVHNGIIKIKADNVDASNYKKINKKGTITIRFAGYREEATYKKNITLSVNTKLPAIKATPQASTLYPNTLADTTKIVLYNNTLKEEILSSNGYSVEVNALDNYKYSNNEYKKAPAIQALNGAKKGTLKFTVTNKKWLSGISVNTSCNLKIGKTPTLSFAQKNLVLNAAYTTGQYEVSSVDAYVKGFEDISFAAERTEIVGKNQKSQKVLDDSALLILMEDGKIKAGVASNGYFTKNETYSFAITAYSEKNMPVSGTLQIKVCPIKNKASVSLKTKGSINLLDRENTCVVVTPTVKNYTATVTDVELYGINSGKFSAQLEDGAIVIHALSEKSIKANTKYVLGANITLDTGVCLQTKITITPKQKNPKLTQSSKAVVLFESARGLDYGAQLTIAPALNQAGEIEDIRMDTKSDTFGYSNGVIYVKDSATLLPGKTHTIKLAVTYKDHAKNVKPAYVTVKIDYRK